MIPEPLEQASDETLVGLGLEGRQAAWSVLVDRYHSKGVRYIRLQLGDPYIADDTIQSVWIDIFRNMQQRAPDSFASLFWTVLKRRVIDQIRKRGRSQESLELDAPMRGGDESEGARQWVGDAPDPADEAVRTEETERLHAALDQLSDHYAAVIRARGLHGMSNRETAQLLLREGLIQDDGNVEKRVENYWYRGMKELAKQLKSLT